MLQVTLNVEFYAVVVHINHFDQKELKSVLLGHCNQAT